MVGTPYANRNATELQDLLGCFVKCDLHPQQSLSIEWVGSLCKQAAAHAAKSLAVPFNATGTLMASCQSACSTLALRLDLSGDPTFSQALHGAKKMAAEAFAHGSTPFVKVVDALDMTRSAAFTPVYQVSIFVSGLFVSVSDNWHSLAGTTLSSVAAESHSPCYQ